MREDGSVQVIPVSEEYRRNYDRVFSKLPDDEPCTVERGSIKCTCCIYNVDGFCTHAPTLKKEEEDSDQQG